MVEHVQTLITSSRYFIELASSDLGERKRRAPTPIMITAIDISYSRFSKCLTIALIGQSIAKEAALINLVGM